MKISHGSVDEFVYFVGLDSTDLKTRETGLSSFSCYCELAGTGGAELETPTVTALNQTTFPGCYRLLVDDTAFTTLASGSDIGNLLVHIEASGMAPVSVAIDVERPKYTEGSTLSDAAITALLESVLASTTMSELTSVPGATPSMVEAIMLGYMAMRNRQTQTAGLATIQNDAGSTIASATVSDTAGTFTKLELT